MLTGGFWFVLLVVLYILNFIYVSLSLTHTYTVSPALFSMQESDKEDSASYAKTHNIKKETTLPQISTITIITHAGEINKKKSFSIASPRGYRTVLAFGIIKSS
jgi:hypothetical protein